VVGDARPVAVDAGDGAEVVVMPPSRRTEVIAAITSQVIAAPRS
jgi:hypothetical protein